MTSAENREIAKQMRFLLFLGEGGTSKRCCCCLSLRTGVIIIALFVILFKIPFYFSTYYYFTYGVRIVIILFDLFCTVAYLFIFISAIKIEFKYAYWAHIASAITAYFYIVGGLVIVLLMGIVSGIKNADNLIDQWGFGIIYAIFIVAYLGNIVGYVVNNYFIFCYTKELGLGHYDVILATDHPTKEKDDNDLNKGKDSPLMTYSTFGKAEI
jgi:hypothetical protein